jgi:hypothetical protein
MQDLLKAYRDQVEGQTRNLMKQWSEEVAKCLQSYETQVYELNGGLDEIQFAISPTSMNTKGYERKEAGKDCFAPLAGKIETHLTLCDNSASTRV